MQLANDKLIHDDYSARFKAATDLYAGYKASGKAGQKGFCAIDVAAAANEDMLEGGREVKTKEVQRAVQQGKAGISPPQGRGPQPALPKALYEHAGTASELSQLEGAELRPSMLYAKLQAAVKDTPYEKNASKPEQARRHLKRVRAVSAVEILQQKGTQGGRIDSCTYEAALKYCKSHEELLVEYKFAKDEPVLDSEGKVLEHVTVPAEKRRRIINSDEKQLRVSNEGDNGGSRTNTLANPKLPRVGQRVSKVSKHVTLHLWTTAAGETGPIHVNFANDADDPNDATVDLRALAGLPEVEGIFGSKNGKKKRWTPTTNASKKGSTDDENFLDFLEQNVVPCFEETLAYDWVVTPAGKVLKGPVAYRTDYGPGRLSLKKPTLLKRKQALADRGFFIIGGMPNSTAMMQEQDQLYGEFQSSTDEVCEAIMEERRAAAEDDTSVTVGLNMADVPRVVNGLATDQPFSRKRPFERAFSVERVEAGWANVGFVPATRKCLESDKLLHDDDDDDPLQVPTARPRVHTSHSMLCPVSAPLAATCTPSQPHPTSAPHSPVSRRAPPLHTPCRAGRHP